MGVGAPNLYNINETDYGDGRIEDLEQNDGGIVVQKILDHALVLPAGKC